MEHSSPHHWLEAEYLGRREKNQAYSLRAFSRLLGIPSGRVSQLLSRKRRFTPKLGRKIAVQLGYDPARTQAFLNTIARNRKKEASLPEPTRELSTLPMDQFEAIADPVHFAILSLLETKRFSGLPRDIASRLGLDLIEARSAAERLVRLGLARFQGERLRLARVPGLTTTHDVQSSALRRAHKKVLEESITALEEVAVELRDITSITMAVDPAKIPEAKERIRAFRRGLSELLESGSREEVYRLNVQLVPLTKRKEK